MFCQIGLQTITTDVLPKLLELYHWQSEHGYGTCMMVLRHILAVLCEMFSVTPNNTDGWVREDPLRGLHARQILILWVFTSGDTWKPLCIQILLTTKRHFSIALRMPVKLSATTPASCVGSWWYVSRRELNRVEGVLSSYFKCILSAITHKLNVSGHVLIWTLFPILVCGSATQSVSAPFIYTLYTV
jgi:hypothetical protein